jgi:hypothetical protein
LEGPIQEYYQEIGLHGLGTIATTPSGALTPCLPSKCLLLKTGRTAAERPGRLVPTHATSSEVRSPKAHDTPFPCSYSQEEHRNEKKHTEQRQTNKRESGLHSRKTRDT